MSHTNGSTPRPAAPRQACYSTRASPASDRFVDYTDASISVVDYFLKHYGITLTMPHLPCLKVGREFDPVEIPMEVCKFLPGQVKRDLTSEQKVHPLTSCSPTPPYSPSLLPYYTLLYTPSVALHPLVPLLHRPTPPCTALLPRTPP